MIGTSSELTTGLTFASSNGAVATVSGAGLITAVAAGTATITVTETPSGKQATVAVTVKAATLQSIAVSPKTFSRPAGTTRQLSVTGSYSDGTTAPLTTGLAFASSNTAVADVSSSGLVSALTAGSGVTITVTETASGKTDTATVTVTPPALVSIAIAPAGPIGPLYVGNGIGDTRQLAVNGTYDNGTVTLLTSGITWQSLSTSVATVDGTGLVTAKGAGPASITAAAGSLPAASVLVNVTAQTLASIAVTPNPITLAPAGTQQLKITGTYDAGPTRDLTSIATYSPVDGTVVSVSAGGLVTGVKNGGTTVTATVGTTSATTSVTVATVTADPSKVFFAGSYAANVTFAKFSSATSIAMTVDSSVTLNGHGSLRVTFPGANYTGGAFVSSSPPDLRAYNAVTFYAKASATLTLEKVGLGNNAGATTNPGHEAELLGIPLTTAWQKFTLPIPDPSKLGAVEGLFHFADGTNHAGTFWLADIQYEAVAGIVLTSTWATTALTLPLGATYQVTGSDLQVLFTDGATGALPTGGTLIGVNANYFSFSSASADVTVSSTGLISALTTSTAGAANITAMLGAVPSGGQLAVTVLPGLPTPTTLPAAPPQPVGAGVVSLWSSIKPGGYNGTASDYSPEINFHEIRDSLHPATGDTFHLTGTGHTADPLKYVLTSDYGSYAGIGWDAHPIDAGALGLDTLHLDVWTPDFATVTGAVLKFQLVDFASGVVPFTAQIFPFAASNPPLSNGAWLSYDLSLTSDFAFAALPNDLRQLVIIAATAPGNNGGTFYVDNLYLYSSSLGGAGGSAPAAPPTAPTAAGVDVVSLFSAAYSGGAAGGDYSRRVDSYDATCFGPPKTSSVADYTIAGTSHMVKQYTIAAKSFGIIELIGATGTAVGSDSPLCNGGTQTGANVTDLSAMVALHLDVWSPRGSHDFEVQLVNAGAGGQVPGPGATGSPTSSQSSSAPIAVSAGSWNPIDIPFSSLGPPGGALDKLALLKFFTADGGTFFVDNVYFHK